MINYEKYAELRDSKGLKDSDIAKITNIPQSTFTAWKKGDYMPKADKMEKIAAALDMEYSEFVGPVGKFSSLNPNRPIPMLAGMEKTPEQRFDDNLLRLYHNATPDARKSVMTLLENSQKDASKSSKEA
ncbi:MAG: helix-turn-helix transcriptional regulator [Clostridiales bacterium]|nr:helix-turn-helix transcriptional regulator [Clostridiales bacterium]